MIERIRRILCWMFQVKDPLEEKIVESYHSPRLQLLYTARWLFILWISYTLFSIGNGMHDANNPTMCRAFSINDIILSPTYSLGCVLAKDRFDIKLN